MVYFANDLIDRLTGLDHYLRFARLFENADELLDRLGRLNVFSFGARGRKLVGDFRRAIENGDGIPATLDIESQVLAHHGQADQTEVSVHGSLSEKKID